VARLEPIDWAEFWSEKVPEPEWLIEPIVPAGRQVALYSVPKTGKSLLGLDASAAAATGRSILGQHRRNPVSVVYIDQEMSRDDLMERLEAFGYGPDSDLSRLAYYQLIDLPPLDREDGGEALEDIVRRHEASLVVLDTMARVVAGTEDSSDTYRAFYRNTGLRLKGLGVALLRFDHAGKDGDRGMRGSSEKAGDVDVVFSMTIRDGIVTLKKTHSRVLWVPAEITLTRDEGPPLAHRLEPEAVPNPKAALAIVRELDRLGLPADASSREAQAALQRAGTGRTRADVLNAMKIRKARP
jgi:RecA-family ATPase